MTNNNNNNNNNKTTTEIILQLLIFYRCYIGHKSFLNDFRLQAPGPDDHPNY